MVIKIRDTHYPEDFIEVDALLHDSGYVVFLTNVPPGDVPHITISKSRWEELKEHIDSMFQSKESVLLTLLPQASMLILAVQMFAFTVNTIVWRY